MPWRSTIWGWTRWTGRDDGGHHRKLQRPPRGAGDSAATIGEESVTLEDVYEPYLMQLGFLTRTPRGRCVTQKAYQHLHKPIPGGAAEGPLMDQLTF